jgi:hypothetical protein
VLDAAALPCLNHLSIDNVVDDLAQLLSMFPMGITYLEIHNVDCSTKAVKGDDLKGVAEWVARRERAGHRLQSIVSHDCGEIICVAVYDQLSAKLYVRKLT